MMIIETMKEAINLAARQTLSSRFLRWVGFIRHRFSLLTKNPGHSTAQEDREQIGERIQSYWNELASGATDWRG